MTEPSGQQREDVAAVVATLRLIARLGDARPVDDQGWSGLAIAVEHLESLGFLCCPRCQEITCDGDCSPESTKPSQPSGQQREDVAAVVATLRQIAHWGVARPVDDQEWLELAGQVEQVDLTAEADSFSCPMCEEVMCDEDCPLWPARSQQLLDYRTAHEMRFEDDFDFGWRDDA